MRLHDIQIILSSSDISSKYQQVYQHQSSAMQSQIAITMIAQSNQKLTQTQETTQSRELKSIDENENRLREWKKEHFNKNEEKKLDKKLTKKDIKFMENFDHIIDIRA
ncbi:MAG: hypothetical protein N3E50_01340 [Candidatus Goldbacteria bacterium]|nr:hypothetical protein [Candidatus Goldiibacteriota bacterium]